MVNLSGSIGPTNVASCGIDGDHEDDYKYGYKENDFDITTER
jgi:hypothetical protein